ncbi:MAG: carboxypeptidase-like regulatory domain-containing protein [Terriglobia bacterium]
MRSQILKTLVLSILGGFLTASQGRADVYGRIRGTATDPTGAVVPGVMVTVTNVETGVKRVVKTSESGTYEVLDLQAPATYSVTAEASGFKGFDVRAISLALNQIYVLDIPLELGQTNQQVTVEATSAQVESTSIELGTTINSRSIVDLPLNGRNWVQLQQLQAGVVAASDGRGNYATNGSQADQNSYLINGTDDNDFILNTVQVTPSPDAIAEFKMVTSTINPEYGRNSGAILNAVIKSGSNQFHGDGFNFYRDTSLNARNFFEPSPDVFHRNQFGGTVGGPIWKNHTFFFFSYQGTRERRPETSGDCGCASPGTVPVYSSDQRNGIFPDVASSSTPSPFPLVGESGATYPAGTPYSTIFPTGHIPTSDFNSVSSRLLKYVPSPTVGSNYEFNPVFGELDDQYLGRIDHTFNSKDAIWGYWLWERESDNQVLPFVGATVPGFGQTDGEHFQQYTGAWNHTFSGSMLNEARVGYTRLNFVAIEPETPTSPASAGFTGITPQLTAGEGLPVVDVLGFFDLGFSEDGPQPRIDQTYQFTDNLTKIVGGHTFKMGFEMRRFEIYNPFSHQNDGFFNFAGTGLYSTGDPGADFLLGIPDTYSQASGDIANTRTQEYYSYFQDQWKVRKNLTLTYGVGWSIDTPTVDNYHDNHAGIDYIPGMQSTVFPTAPTGYVFQGDPGVNAFGTTHFRDFGPRFGFAYSPSWGWLTGAHGTTSIRAGFGIYFNRFNGETTTQTQGSPPFAASSVGVADISTAAQPLSPGFANPFADIAGNGSEANKFPYTPSASPNFSLLEPFTISVYDGHISVPYSENFNFTIERQLGADTILSLAYVGALGHREMLTIEENPGLQPAACAANPACGSNPFGQSTNYPGNFRYPGNIISSIGDVATVGNSNYSAFQASLERHFSHGLQFLAAYTWAHSLDNGSGFENSGFGGGGFGGFGQTRGINPFDQDLNYGPSTFDATQRLVINYVYAFPSVRKFDSLHWLPSRLTDGWQMSGITTFQSGFPVDVIDSAFPSLTCPYPDFYVCWDVPNVVGPIHYMNPRNNPSNYFADPTAFGAPALGTQGNAGRNLLRGPGINNFDFALMKDVKLTESTRIELRFEFFNIFNHTQFDPAGITSDINAGSTFLTDLAARDPRLIQLAGKFYF